MPSLRSKLLVSLVIGVNGFTASLQAGDKTAVAPAWQVDFLSVVGHAYRMEASSSQGVPNWEPCTEVAFGTGGLMRLEGTLAEMEAGKNTFRIAEVDPAQIGIAPVVLHHGQTLSLQEQAGCAQIVLFTNTKGVYRLATGAPISMAWSYVKTAADRGRLTGNLQNGITSIVEIEFTSAGAGKFTRQYWTSAQTLADSAVGIFSLSQRQVWPTQGEGKMPTNLVGRTFNVQTAGEPVTYTFAANTVLRKIGPGPGLNLPYTFEPETGTAGLVQMEGEELRLTASTPSAGGVVRTKLVAGTSGVQEFGSFTRAAEPATTVSAHCSAPNALDDLTFQISDSLSGTATMEFGKDGEGTRSLHVGGSIQQSPYSYSYTRLDVNTGRVVTVLPLIGGDEVDEMLLTFTGENDCAGTYERKHYRNGQLLSSSNGTFGPGLPPPGL